MKTITCGTDQVQVCNWQGVDYVACYVSPRGFANEHSTYVVRAEDAGRLQRFIERRRSREPGDGFGACWMSAQEIAQHIHSGRIGDQYYLLTKDADGNDDSLVL